MKTDVFKLIGMPRIEKTLRVLSKWNKDGGGEFEGMWYRYSELSKQTRIPVKKLKPLMKFLKELDVVYYTHLLSDEYLMCGQGYILESKYVDLKWEQIKEKRISDRT